MRTFTSPSGRRWSASIFYVPSLWPGILADSPVFASSSVLRFVSADITLDLKSGPDDWFRLSDEALVELLRKAQPPSFTPPFGVLAVPPAGNGERSLNA